MFSHIKSFAFASRALRIRTVIMLTTLASSAGMAHVDGLQGGCIGVSAGMAKMPGQWDQADIDSISFIGSCQDTAIAWSVAGRFRFTVRIAVELGYHDLGSYCLDGTARGGSSSRLGYSGTAKASGITLAGVGSIPIRNSFSVLGKLGVNFWSSDVESQLSGSDPAAVSETGTVLYGAVSAAYFFTQHVGLQALYECFPRIGKKDTLGTDDVHARSAGIIVKF